MHCERVHRRTRFGGDAAPAASGDVDHDDVLGAIGISGLERPLVSLALFD